MILKPIRPFNKKTAIYAISGLLVLIVAALLAGGYAWIAKTSPLHAGPLEKVTIATTAYAGSCSILAAQEKGYFAAEGVLVSLQFYTSGKSALDATLQGQANLATSADLPIMFAALRGQPVLIVATIFATDQDYEIVGRKDRGIVSPASLKGKRIGVTLNTSGHFFLDAFLNRQKLSMSEVTVRDLKPEDISEALVKGDIDAVSTWEPYASAIRERIGANGTDFSIEGVYDATYSVSGIRDYVVSHPDTIKKILRALVAGGQFCKDEGGAAREIVAKVMKTDAAKLKPFWRAYQFDVALDQSLVLALEDEARWAIKSKLGGGSDMPNYLDYIYLDGLLAVMPNAVTVIH